MSRICCILVLLSLPLIVSAQVSRKMEGIFQGKTKISDPFSLRDPFKKPLPVVEVDTAKSGSTSQSFSASKESVDLTRLNIKDLKLVGIIYGKERLALIKAGDSPGSIVLKEGMKIGPDQIELKAVFPSGVVFVEKIINAYDEEEYVELIIPYVKNVNISTSRASEVKEVGRTTSNQQIPFSLQPQDPWAEAMKNRPQTPQAFPSSSKTSTKKTP